MTHEQAVLDELAGDVEAFLQATSEEHYQNGAGIKPELQLTPIYARHAHLFERESLERVRRVQMQARDDETRRRARYLLDFLTGGYLESAVKERMEALVTRETQATVPVEGEAIPYRTLPVRIANEPDRQRRQRLFEARQAFTAELNPEREAIWRIAQRQVRSLGYDSSLSMYRELKGIDYPSLGRRMRELLSRTQDAYERWFGPALARQSGAALGQARKHDVAWMLRATTFDAMFPADRLLDALHRTLRGLGIDLGGQPNVHLDTEVRPHKSPRAFCAPVRVPHDIRLVILPQGGRDDYHALLHEAGHTEHFAHTQPDLPVEFRYLGDNSVTESFAFLFEYLTTNPQWLQDVLGISGEQSRAYRTFAYLDRLYFLRRYAGKLLYEIELHSATDLGGMPARYDAILSQATGVQYGTVDYLDDVDAGFYVAEYLRAWALEVMMRERLVERYGLDWFARREAGDLLRELWADGQREDGDELARRLGYSEVDFEPLIRELEAGPPQDPA